MSTFISPNNSIPGGTEIRTEGYTSKEQIAKDMKGIGTHCHNNHEEAKSQIIMKSRCHHGHDDVNSQLLNDYTAKLLATPITIQERQAKKEALHQEVMRKRNLRKATRNKALSVAKNKYERRRVVKGATAQELLNPRTEVKSDRSRTVRRQDALKLKKMARKYSTKRVEPANTTGETSKTE